MTQYDRPAKPESPEAWANRIYLANRAEFDFPPIGRIPHFNALPGKPVKAPAPKWSPRCSTCAGSGSILSALGGRIPCPRCSSG